MQSESVGQSSRNSHPARQYEQHMQRKGKNFDQSSQNPWCSNCGINYSSRCYGTNKDCYTCRKKGHNANFVLREIQVLAKLLLSFKGILQYPVIDLAKASSSTINHAGLVQELLNASQEFGIFQIINHGVFEKLMDDLMDLFKKLFDMSVEEKEELCSGGSRADRCRTGSRIGERVVQKPSPDGKPLPALSRPKSAMGVPPHCDPNIVTFTQQQVYGLEILKDGTFVAPPGDYIVEPMKAPVNGDSPARFWAFKFKEFLDDFVQKDSQKTLDAYKLQP
ncbi:hypothetical protein FXO37_03649 [Capsicum annuum]|nr:hypothetical protein FXO37_03649 [Capsicum annuum]